MKHKAICLIFLASLGAILPSTARAKPDAEAARKWIPFSHSFLELSRELALEFQRWEPLIEDAMAYFPAVEVVQLPELSVHFWLERFSADTLQEAVFAQSFLTPVEQTQLHQLLGYWLQQSQQIADVKKVDANMMFSQLRVWHATREELVRFLQPRMQAAGNQLLLASEDGAHLIEMKKELRLAFELLHWFERPDPVVTDQAEMLLSALKNSLEASHKMVPPRTALFPVKQAYYMALTYSFVPRMEKLLTWLQEGDYRTFNDAWPEEYAQLQSSYAYAQQQFRLWIQMRESPEMGLVFGIE